jgi:hypothetical protein
VAGATLYWQGGTDFAFARMPTDTHLGKSSNTQTLVPAALMAIAARIEPFPGSASNRTGHNGTSLVSREHQAMLKVLEQLHFEYRSSS